MHPEKMELLWLWVLRSPTFIYAYVRQLVRQIRNTKVLQTFHRQLIEGVVPVKPHKRLKSPAVKD